MKFSKRFLNSGWAPVLGGDAARSLGSATLAFFYMGAAILGTWRIVTGKRITRIERREHGTPTGRCSCGHWIVEWKGASPVTLREWGTFGDFAAWFVEASPDERATWTWTDYPRGDLNYCPEKAIAGRGRTLRGMPGNVSVLGYSPANGKRTRGHDAPRSPAAPPPRLEPTPAPNRAASVRRAHSRDVRGKGKHLANGAYRVAADVARAEIAEHARFLRIDAGIE
jgi:hypothetical protein